MDLLIRSKHKWNSDAYSAFLLEAYKINISLLQGLEPYWKELALEPKPFDNIGTKTEPKPFT